jgi:hypothetical protein
VNLGGEDRHVVVWVYSKSGGGERPQQARDYGRLVGSACGARVTWFKVATLLP